MNELKSYTEYAVSTPTADFVIGLDFNYGEDVVNVTIDDVPATTAGYTVVYLNETTIRLSPSVTSGVVRLQRETNIDEQAYVFRAGAKFVAQSVDENFKQVRKAQQELRDSFGKLVLDTDTRLDGFYTNVQEVQAEFTVIKAIANNAELNAATALSNATSALNTANGIDAKATTALSNSTEALTVANGIDAKATNALDNSVAAELAATTALNTANGIDAKATEALQSATTALDTATAIDGKATDALDTADAASTLASNALSKTADLSDLSSVVTARNNLEVYSKTYIDTELLKKANVAGVITYFSALMNTLYVNNNDFDITIYVGFKLPANANANVQVGATIIGFCTNYNTVNVENFYTITFRVPARATYRFNTVGGNPSVALIGWQA